MRCAANFEIGSDVSVIADSLVLTILDPRGAFEARIKNIPRADYSVPFLLSFHIYFDAKSLKDAKVAAEICLTDCLNMLAFVTGSGFRKHRLRQIVDADGPANRPTRGALHWADKITYDDPQPFLSSKSTRSIERLLQHDVPPAIKRALRWYRLGIDAASPDDQFTYFWFALEIVAEFTKPTTKVHDKCPHCQNALYCETCNKHPQHKPYAKQAIRALIAAADELCDDHTINLLDKARNSLLHGSTLKEIESILPDPHESIVDILGRLLWKALIKQFPKEVFAETLVVGTPSTYIHYKMNAFAHIETVVGADSEGYLKLDFDGIDLTFKPNYPPQSALPTFVDLANKQYERLQALSLQNDEYRPFLTGILERVEKNEEGFVVPFLATEMTRVWEIIREGKKRELIELLSELFQSDK